MYALSDFQVSTYLLRFFFRNPQKKDEVNIAFLNIQFDNLTVAFFSEYPKARSKILGQFSFQYAKTALWHPNDVILIVPEGMG